MIKRKHSKKRFLIVVATVVISTLAVIISRQYIEKEMQVQLYGNLRDVAMQNKVTIEDLLNDQQNMLYEIADELHARSFSFETEEQIWDIVEWLKNYDNIYDSKRMGIIALDGTAYSTDGFQVKLSDEPYQYGKQGIANISSKLMDAIGTEEPINVFSVPVFGADGKTVEGILFATYRTEMFIQLLDVASFDGQGYSYIVRDDGTVIVDSQKSQVYGAANVFERMLSISADNKDLVDRVRTAMLHKESGYETFYVYNERSMYYTPIEVDSVNQTWYLLTMVPTSVLDEKAEQVLFYQDILVIVVFLAITGLVLYFVITYQRDAKLLRNMAYRDPLTEDDNTHALYEQMRNRKINWGYMVAIDINDFKLINSVCGIDKGDETIRRVWKTIRDSLGPRDMAAHIGGDHYVMYLQEVYKDKILDKIRKISDEIEALSEELQIISIFPYFGIYEIKDNRDPEENYNCANQAKKLVKGNKTKNWAFYEELDFQKIVDDRNLMDSFKSAIENEEFEIWYQPKYSGHDSSIVGAEALVRWRKNDGTLIPPYRFIPLFESNGMIITLDEYVFTKVCQQQKKWEEEGYRIFPISVNISRASLYFGNIVKRYTDIVNECKITPAMVPLEITESATVNNSQISGLIECFRNAGFPLYMDDFGNGYSSIALLRLIHFDVLKLDKSLVDFIGDEAGEKLLVYTIKLAKSMGMSITAEGVETQEQVVFLNEQDCDEIQGYYFSKPLPLDEFCELLGK